MSSLNTRVSYSDRMVGNPSLIALRQSSPSCIPNLPCAETSEVQFDFVPQKSGHEGAVSNAVTWIEPLT